MKKNAHKIIEAWFWDLISECSPSLKYLEEQLESFSEEKLKKYLMYWDISSRALCAPWDGPYIDDEIEQLSEDSTEELTDWIVSQGKSAWEYALRNPDQLSELFCISNGNGKSKEFETTLWNTKVSKKNHIGFQSPKDIAIIIIEELFEEDYWDFREEYFEKYQLND
jgi:hypothetical protein